MLARMTTPTTPRPARRSGRALLALVACLATPSIAAPGSDAASGGVDARAAEAAYMRAAFEHLGPGDDGRVAIASAPAAVQGYLRAADADADGALSLAEFTDFQLDPGGAGRRPLPEGVTRIADVAYAGTDHPRQQLDLYLPAARVDGERLPVVAYVHGGAWNMGSRAMARGQVAPLVASGDYAAVAIGYRLSWQATWPAQRDDLEAALAWVRAHADAYGLDAGRVCAMGASAGGHLAAVLGTSSEGIACAVDFFGPTDLTQPPPPSRMAAMGGGPSSREQLLGASPERVPALARDASPLLHVDAGDPPFLIVHGTADPLVSISESERLAAALSSAGVEAYFVAVEGGGHGDFLSPETAPAAAAEVDARVRAFLDRSLRGTRDAVSTDPIPLR